MLEPIPFAGFVEIPDELTDEEIIAIANQSLVCSGVWQHPDLDPIKFARAILRKAQEK
mgnify:CR=1 FL=1|tara:strand:- start:204 stop:377 length:174 start_codon:yes stop_codon:yes gene_type:complete